MPTKTSDERQRPVFSPPPSYDVDLRRAVEILKGAGCSDVYVFGSLAHGRAHEGSDIDLAVHGCPKRLFFRVVAKLRRALSHAFDLVDLDADDPFVRLLEKNQELVRIA